MATIQEQLERTHSLIEVARDVLPQGWPNHVVITGSSAAVLRGYDIGRLPGDLDLCVSHGIYAQLMYPWTTRGVPYSGLKRLPDAGIEAAFRTEVLDYPHLKVRATKAPTAQGFLVASICDVLALKHKLSRPKDLADIALIENQTRQRQLAHPHTRPPVVRV